MSVKEGKDTQEGLKLYNKGEFLASTKFFLKSINDAIAKKQKPAAHDFNYLACAIYALKDFKQATRFFNEAVKLKPESISYRRNLGLLHYRLGEFGKAKEHLDVCLRKNQRDVIVLDAYAAFSYKVSNKENSFKYGRRSLRIKDEDSCTKEQLRVFAREKWQLNKVEIPPFNTKNRKSNIISYSLWGQSNFYLEGAILNAQLVPVIFPNWTARFYCEETVPQNIIEKLKSYGAEIVMIPKTELAYYGLFWRFLVVNDPKVERYLIRDCDSVPTCQERLAVDEWIESRKRFHIIRDYYTHTELILAGLWGGIGGALPNIKMAFDAFYKKNQRERTIDQIFLRRCIWPLIRDDCLTHDEYFSFGTSVRGFSDKCRNHSLMHVGQSWKGIYDLEKAIKEV